MLSTHRWTRHLLDAALGLVLTGVSVVAVEAALWAAKVTPAPSLELSRGFDPRVDYIVPDPEHPGSKRTVIGMPAIDRKAIPPHGKALRVLLFGGSNTRGLPDGYLRNLLCDNDSARPFEVHNLGRNGYGSERVAILFEQALEHLEPDVVVLYLGHNEFVERSLKEDVELAWGGFGQRTMADLSQRLRLVRLLRDVARRRLPERQARPENWRREYNKFEGMPYAETERQFEQYAANVRRMLTLARERGTRVVLATVVYNRFSMPRVTTTPSHLDADALQRLEEHRSAAQAGYPSWFETLLPRSPQERMKATDWRRRGGSTPGDLPGLRPLRGPLADRTPLFPVGKWSPRVRAQYEALDHLHRGADDAERQGLEEAAQALDRALALAPKHAHILFERALVAWALGERGERVTRWLEDAARYDHAPRKANGLVNDHVRALAAEFPEVLLVDVDRFASEASADGLVGWELMTDHCHLSPLGSNFALEVISEALLKAWYGQGEEH